MGREPNFLLPAELGQALGIVDAAAPPGTAAPAVAPKPAAGRTAQPAGQANPNLASIASRRLVPVVTAACNSCRVERNASTGAIRVTLGSGARTSPGSAFALLDFGGSGGAAGVVRVHDRIGLDRGQLLTSDLSLLQVTDVDNRVAYRLQVDRNTRTLSLLSPPGGLSRAALNLSTGVVVPNDGRTLSVDVAAQAGRSLLVQVNGQTVISRQDLSGGDARNQRFLAVGILNTPAGFTTMSVTHGQLHVEVSSPSGNTQSAVSATGLTLAPEQSLVPPANVAAPAITGTLVTGNTLTADLGSWSAADSTRVRWSRCAGDGTGCQAIADATGPSYVLQNADAGNTFVISVTAANAAGTAVAASGLTPVVANFKPLNVTSPSITGTARQGSVLTAAPGTWQWRNGSFTYAWQRCDASGTNCVPISGETGVTHTLGLDDVGFTIRLLVTAPGITAPSVAAAPVSAVVQLAPPNNVGVPEVTGNTLTGAVLTATTGDWSGSTLSYVYSWERCTTDGTCSPIEGTNAGTYRVGLEDLGHPLRVTVTASNNAGSAVASSSLTDTITFGGPTNSGLPALSGNPVVGSTLTLDTGTWSDPQASIAVEWQRCGADGSGCSAIADASGTSYTLADGDAGSTIQAVVTATNVGGSSSATSAATPVINRPTPPPVPPTNSVPPVISGDATVGSTLTLDTGTWSDPQASITVVWQRCAADGTACTPIVGATGTSYVPIDADVGSTLEAVVTATDNGGSTSVTSAATAVVAQVVVAPAPPVNSVLPVIAGNLTVGSTLTVDTGTWNDPQAVITVAWQRCNADGTACSVIANATGSSYLVTDASSGSTLEAVVTATNAAGSSSATSSPTAVVPPQ